MTGLPLPRISDLAHAAEVRLWELSPHQASLEEAYMRMTQGAVDYRSTADARAGLQEAPAGFAPQGPPPQGYAGGPGYPAGQPGGPGQVPAGMPGQVPAGVPGQGQPNPYAQQAPGAVPGRAIRRPGRLRVTRTGHPSRTARLTRTGTSPPRRCRLRPRPHRPPPPPTSPRRTTRTPDDQPSAAAAPAAA